MELAPNLLTALIDNKREPQKVLSLFAGAGLDAGALSRVNSAPDPITPYSRVVLSSAPGCEIMLARWTAGRVCAPHDHGSSAGWVFYFENDFEEQGYRWQGESSFLTRRTGTTRGPTRRCESMRFIPAGAMARG